MALGVLGRCGGLESEDLPRRRFSLLALVPLLRRVEASLTPLPRHRRGWRLALTEVVRRLPISRRAGTRKLLGWLAATFAVSEHWRSLTFAAHVTVSVTKLKPSTLARPGFYR